MDVTQLALLKYDELFRQADGLAKFLDGEAREYSGVHEANLHAKELNQVVTDFFWRAQKQAYSIRDDERVDQDVITQKVGEEGVVLKGKIIDLFRTVESRKSEAAVDVWGGDMSLDTDNFDVPDIIPTIRRYGNHREPTHPARTAQ